MWAWQTRHWEKSADMIRGAAHNRGESRREQGVIFQELKHLVTTDFGRVRWARLHFSCLTSRKMRLLLLPMMIKWWLWGSSKLVFMLEQNLVQGSYWVFSIVIIIKKKQEKLFEITDCRALSQLSVKFYRALLNRNGSSDPWKALWIL